MDDRTPTPTDRWARLRRLLAAVDVPDSAERWLEVLPASEGVHVVSFVNAHGFNLAARDGSLADALVASDTLFRDGSGMRILMTMLGREPGPNLNGTDLIPRIVDRFAADHLPIAFLGTTEPWLTRAADVARSRGARVEVLAEGFERPAAYADLLAGEPCRLVVLGMGMPKQELVSMLLREQLRGPTVVVNGGAILDFMAGRFARAPQWMRRLGIEWVYRLVLEPRRLFTRYVVGNAAFLWRALRLRLGAGA
jgi:exopolysaccharide biosynthesis WecB/TagA/CpsF family protein